MGESSAGKGDTYRYVDPKKWEENYERIFGHKDIFDFHKDKTAKSLKTKKKKK
jgi:hypothetical protein